MRAWLLTGEDERGGGADEAQKGGELVAVERGRHRVECTVVGGTRRDGVESEESRRGEGT